MKKKLLKKELSLFLIIVIMITMLFGCGNSNTEVDDYGVTGELVDLTVNEYLEPDENGVVKLYDGLYSVDVDYDSYAKSYETQRWYASHHHLYDLHYFVYKHVDTKIRKVNKEDTIAICDDYASDSILLVPIDDEPQYTVPLFFDIYKERGFAFAHCFVKRSDEDLPMEDMGKDIPMVDLGELGDYGCGITECNGQDFVEFTESNAITFYRGEEWQDSCACESESAREYGDYHYAIYDEEDYWIYLDVYDDRSIIVADENEEIEIGGYEGTQWISKKLTANIEFYTPGYDESIELPLEKTKNGYFTIDSSDLYGTYYIPRVNCFIEIV